MEATPSKSLNWCVLVPTMVTPTGVAYPFGVVAMSSPLLRLLKKKRRTWHIGSGGSFAPWEHHRGALDPLSFGASRSSCGRDGVLLEWSSLYGGRVCSIDVEKGWCGIHDLAIFQYAVETSSLCITAMNTIFIKFDVRQRDQNHRHEDYKHRQVCQSHYNIWMEHIWLSRASYTTTPPRRSGRPHVVVIPLSQR